MEKTELCEVQVNIVSLVVKFRSRGVKRAGRAERENGERCRKVWLGNPQAISWQDQNRLHPKLILVESLDCLFSQSFCMSVLMYRSVS